VRAYSGKELVSLLQRHGRKVERIEGNHHIMTRAGREETLSVPAHATTA